MSHTTAILLIFHGDTDLKGIEHINISLIMCHQGCNFCQQDAIHRYMGSIRADLVVTKKRYGVAGISSPCDPTPCLWATLGGRIAVQTNPPYCLIYPKTYLSTIPLLEWTPFNTVGSPPGLHLGKCMCCALLQVADLSAERKWQYAGSHLIIPHGAQFINRFPTIIEPCNHSLPLRNAEVVPYPIEAVGNFALEDKIFPGIPGDSLLFDGAELMRLWQKNYSIPMHLPPVSHTGHSPNIASGGCALPEHLQIGHRGPESRGYTPCNSPRHPPNSRDGKKSHHHRCPKGKVLPKKKDEAMHKDSDSTSSKKSHGGGGRNYGSSKDSAASPLKCTLDQTDSPSWRRWKEPQLEVSSRPISTVSCRPVCQRTRLTWMSSHPSSLHLP